MICSKSLSDVVDGNRWMSVRMPASCAACSLRLTYRCDAGSSPTSNTANPGTRGSVAISFLISSRMERARLLPSINCMVGSCWDRVAQRERAYFFAQGIVERICVKRCAELGKDCGTRVFVRWNLHILRMCRKLTDPRRNLLHVRNIQPARGDGWRAKAQAAWIDGGALFLRNRVLVGDESNALQSVIKQHAASDSRRREVCEDQVIIRPPTHKRNAAFHKRFCERLCVSHNAFCVIFKSWL